MRGLLIGVSKLNELWFAPRASQEFDADRKAVGGESARHHDRGKAGIGGKMAIRARLDLADQICPASYCGVGKCIDVIVGHRFQNCLPQSIALDDVFQILLGVPGLDCLRITQVHLDGLVKFPSSKHV